jgi:hypothetical protein
VTNDARPNAYAVIQPPATSFQRRITSVMRLAFEARKGSTPHKLVPQVIGGRNGSGRTSAARSPMVAQASEIDIVALRAGPG